MNRYIRQFFSLLGTIFKQIIQRFSDRLAARLRGRKSPQPASPQRESDSFTKVTRTAAEASESERVDTVLIAQNKRNDYKHHHSRRKSKRTKWAENKEKQDLAYAEARKNGDNERIREYWKWIQKYGASTKEYYARAKTRRTAAKKVADRNEKITSAEAKQRKAAIEAESQCKPPENEMIEHLEDHRDAIGWSIDAMARKRFYLRRTLKSNDSNGDMFCEVDDDGKSLFKAVKQLIHQHGPSGKADENIL
jgi:hypothetical protein